MTLFLLPPSETKRDGGAPRSRLALSRLGYRELTDRRAMVLERVEQVCAEDEEGARALRLSARAAPVELARNRSLRRSETLAAVERYTGVLYDALAVTEWDAASRARATEHVGIQSALFGLIGADDRIPAYRLSHDSRLPGLRLAAHWAPAVSTILSRQTGPIIDLRSEAYAALGPLPTRADAVFVRVMAVGRDGVAKALSHANKASKGAFVRSILTAGPVPDSVEGLCERAHQQGWVLRPGTAGELDLVVQPA